MTDNPPVKRTIDISVGFQGWQARCLTCGWAYLLVVSDESAEERPPFRHCAVCGQAAVYFRLDPS